MKHLNWLAILLALCLIASFAVVACGDDDDDDDTCDKTPGNDIYTDNELGIIWQSYHYFDTYTLQEANVYCENLYLACRKNWRVPTISELRSIIVGCPATETGGQCGVTDECTGSSCMNDYCESCGRLQGNGSGGEYWLNLFGISEGTVAWSSSLANGQDAWVVSYEWGSIRMVRVHEHTSILCVHDI